LQRPALQTLDNQRNDRIFQLENAVNDPELNPDDLRFLANELSNPLNQVANNHWISLAETERRDYAQALRQRANYIEFNPRDLAQRIIGEEEPQHHVDALTLLENNDYDHEVLRGLAPTERARAAQATALEMQRLLEEPQLRALNPNGVPPAATQISPAQLDVLYNNYVRDYQRLLDDGEITETWTPAELADFIRGNDEIGTHNPTQAQREALAQLVETRGLPETLARNAEYSATAEEIVNLLEEGYYTETPNARAAVRLIRQHLRALRRNGEMAFEDILGMATTGYEWSPELLTALEIKLESLIERYQGMDDYADGGSVQGYQKGGTVKKPDSAYAVPVQCPDLLGDCGL